MARCKETHKRIFSKIKVVGVGGAGGSAIKRMLKANILGVEYVAINTDAQALQSITGRVKKIRIGKSLTKGLGTGADPELGQAAAEQNTREIKESLKNADIIFITAGLGGGVGTGASPVVADIAAKIKNVLTLAIVTKPFVFEGPQRKAIAEQGLKKLINRVDALMTISNNKLLYTIDRSTPILEAFDIADEVLKQGVQAFSDILNIPGLINVDFADVKPVLQGGGVTMLGIGHASGKDRAAQAAKNALNNPLMDLSANEANGIVFIITGSPDLKMAEVNEIAEIITKEIDPMAKIVFGAVIDENLKDEIKVTLIATNYDQIGDYGFSLQSLEDMEEEQELSRSLTKETEKGKIYVYREKQNKETKKKTKGKKEKEQDLPAQSEFNFEDELDIPAFLRKKLKSR
ncbi:cell division protein FtsZ [Patescibacteria group bacterium]|nr:cell division protein FtsZ [Patescibacteria group bacterium]